MTVQTRIVSAIDKIPKGDIIKMTSFGGYPLRVGDYRVLFDINEIIIDIIILEIVEKYTNKRFTNVCC